MQLEILVALKTAREIENSKRRILDIMQGKTSVTLIRFDEIRISEQIPKDLHRALQYPVGIKFSLAELDRVKGMDPDWLVTTDEECIDYFKYQGCHILTNIEDLYDILEKMPENGLNDV